jgi:hypothetical protein
MKSLPFQLAAIFLTVLTINAPAAGLHVDLNSTNPVPPYADWSTAATNIQDAVDASSDGDLVLVTNGVYQTGGRVVYGSIANRVVVDKAVTVQSVNGPATTIIQGYQVPGDIVGDNAVRCAYLTNGAVLMGFTLANGATRSAGSEPPFEDLSGGGVWCESASAVVSDCVLTGNSSSYGGGAYNGTLNNCIIYGNTAAYYWGYANGGGAYNSTLNNCSVTANLADYGGGTSYGTLNNCTLTLNSATTGGGVYDSTLNNCIVYFNSAPNGNNYWYEFPSLLNDSSYTGGYVNYSCTTPLPDSGTGNISADPQLTDSLHLGSASPCRGAGSADHVTGVDIDGEAWASPPAIGCDEYHSGATGPLSVFIRADYTNVVTGFPVNFTAQIVGHASSNHWDFGDGMGADNQPFFAAHSWGTPGDYPVVLAAYNDSNPGGVSGTVTVHVVAQPVHYVALDSTNPVAPYTSWDTAATNIQDAVDAASVPGALVLVTNGIYQTGGQIVYGAMFNRVAVTKPITVQSVNGPAATIIQGFQVPDTINGDSAVRCVYLTNTATLAGFTLAGGATRMDGDWYQEQSGGGVWCESAAATVSNCVIAGNFAAGAGGAAYGGTLRRCTLNTNSAAFGGGAYQSTLEGCLLTGNTASANGGGAGSSALGNCNLTGNSAVTGGGADACTLNNCIVYYNTAPAGPNYSGSTLNYCCTTPLPDTGTGNPTAQPQLADFAHLSAGSPCRGTGSAAYASGVDIDGEAWASPPSIGCDEYRAGAITGPLSVSIQATYTNVAAGFAVNFVGTIDGHAGASRWDFGDGMVASNQPYASHSWAATGNYPVELRAYNEDYPNGVSATVTVYVVESPVHYVALDSTNPVAPYFSWDTAATNIQDAVDAAFAGSTVLVGDGVYTNGERVVRGIPNRVAVTKPLVVQSANGPVAATIDGGGAVRCVYLATGTALVGFTLSNGVISDNGGGVYCESVVVVVSNCAFSGNSAGSGGGAYGGILNNCTFSGNSAANYGGGAYGGTLNDCTIDNTSAYLGGGAATATLNNCSLAGNFASGAGGAAQAATLNGCTISGNSAGNYGGAGWACTFNNCAMSGCSAFIGGAVGYSTLSNCMLTANHCMNLGGAADLSTLDNCILTGNYAGQSGGAAYESTLNNCTISNNSAYSYYGGGVHSCGLNNCTLTGNYARYQGGGAYASTLINCTLTGNTAYWSAGGGAYASSLNNCIVYYNTAGAGDNYSGGDLSYCCTTPLPAGPGNITNEPLFVNLTTDFHLQTNSPCINSGYNAFVDITNDLDGNPRIKSGTVDIGAYEYQTPTSVISYAWLQQYGLTNNGSADYADTDVDGMNNWQEWIAGTDPTDPSSLLKMTTVTNDVSGMTVTWQSVSGVTYFLQRGTDLGAQPAFFIIQTNIAGQPGTTSYTDTDAVGAGPFFYRVGVQ